MHYSCSCANLRLSEDLFTWNWRDMTLQILTTAMLGKIDPFALNFGINRIYRLKNCVGKHDAILNWIILDCFYHLRNGHKFGLPITDKYYTIMLRLNYVAYKSFFAEFLRNSPFQPRGTQHNSVVYPEINQVSKEIYYAQKTAESPSCAGEDD